MNIRNIYLQNFDALPKDRVATALPGGYGPPPIMLLKGTVAW